jgi:CBS domain-containing protein
VRRAPRRWKGWTVKRIKGLKSRTIGTLGISRDASIADAVRELVKHDVSALVVYDGERLAGIFTKNDLVRCCAQHPDGIGGLGVTDYMKRDIYTAQVDSNLDEVIEHMVEGGFRHVPVLDGDRVVGMVTPIDVLVHQKGSLKGEREELVRYIQGLY